MFYVYFLQSQKDKKLYIGRTNNIERRLAEHNRGLVQSTRARCPLKLLGYEEYKTEKESIMMELEWKKGYKREQLKIKFDL